MKLTWFRKPACCSILLLSLASAQQLSGHEVTIWNSANSTITFQLSEDGERWKDFSLKPDGQNTFDSKGQLLVRIMTAPSEGAKAAEGEPELVSATYRLKEQERYRLLWNRKSKKWDIVRMKPR